MSAITQNKLLPQPAALSVHPAPILFFPAVLHSDSVSRTLKTWPAFQTASDSVSPLLSSEPYNYLSDSIQPFTSVSLWSRDISSSDRRTNPIKFSDSWTEEGRGNQFSVPLQFKYVCSILVGCELSANIRFHVIVIAALTLKGSAGQLTFFPHLPAS